MCKTNMKMDFYYANICKYEHEKNMRKSWCKIMLKTNIEHIERNEGSYFYLYRFGDTTTKRGILRSKYPRKQQRNQIPKTRSCEHEFVANS